MTKPAYTNLGVTCWTGGTRFCLAWERGGDRYHVWLDPKTYEVEPATVGHKRNPMLYKNPPLDVKHGDPGYYRTRHLDASKHMHFIKHLIEEARSQGMFKAALQADRSAENMRLVAAQAEALENRIKESGPVLLNAAREAIAYLDLDVGHLPNQRKTLRRKLADAIKAATGETL